MGMMQTTLRIITYKVVILDQILEKMVSKSISIYASCNYEATQSNKEHMQLKFIKRRKIKDNQFDQLEME